MRRTTLLLCLLAALSAAANASGCATSNAGTDEDGGAGMIDAGIVPPTPDAGSPEGKPARALLGFCSGGGWVRSDGVSGPICFGPVDVASVPRRVGTMTWWPGPLSHAAP
jgi:hypothetical protein